MGKRTCTIGGCNSPHAARGYCVQHYNQWKRTPDNVGAPIREYGPPRWARDADMRKWCNGCSLWLVESRFAKSHSALDGLQHHCRECRKLRYRANTETVRDSMRERRFGLDRAAFDEMLESQGGSCAICGTKDPGSSYWHVDHDHSCCMPGKAGCGRCVRGILCRGCNHGLGLFRDSPERLESAAAYLRIKARTTLRSVR